MDPRTIIATPEGRFNSVHIVGGPGSVKTTLAHEIADRLSTPCVDLDEVAYEGGSGSRRPRQRRLEAVAAIAEHPRWVTEGIYLGWTHELFESADLIVWLDPPRAVACYRIVVGHARTSLAGNNRHPGLLKPIRFLLWTRHYYLDPEKPRAASDRDGAVTRSATAHAVTTWRDRLVRCRTGADTRVLLDRITAGGPEQ